MRFSLREKVILMIPFPRSSLVILLVYFHLEYRKKTHNYSADFSYSSLLVSLTPTTNFLPTFQYLLEMLLTWDKLIELVLSMPLIIVMTYFPMKS